MSEREKFFAEIRDIVGESEALKRENTESRKQLDHLQQKIDHGCTDACRKECDKSA